MLHEPEYHILYNMYLELSMSTALNYYGAEFNRLWSKLIGGSPLMRKSLMRSPTFAVLAYVCASGGVSG